MTLPMRSFAEVSRCYCNAEWGSGPCFLLRVACSFSGMFETARLLNMYIIYNIEESPGIGTYEAVRSYLVIDEDAPDAFSSVATKKVQG
jgi:hypothetical protein